MPTAATKALVPRPLASKKRMPFTRAAARPSPVACLPDASARTRHFRGGRLHRLPASRQEHRESPRWISSELEALMSTIIGTFGPPRYCINETEELAEGRESAGSAIGELEQRYPAFRGPGESRHRR